MRSTLAVALVEDALHVQPRLGRGAQDAPRRPRAPPPAQLLVRDDARDQAHAQRLRRVERAAGQQEVARVGEADVRRQVGGIAGVGDTAQQLGRAEGRALARDRDVGEHRDQEPAALADAVHRRDDRRGAVAHRLERERRRSVPRSSSDRVRVLHLAAQLAARREDVADAGDDQRGRARARVDDCDGALDRRSTSPRESALRDFGRSIVHHAR